MHLRLGYNYTEGTPELRAAIATWYPGASAENVLDHCRHGGSEFSVCVGVA